MDDLSADWMVVLMAEKKVILRVALLAIGKAAL